MKDRALDEGGRAFPTGEARGLTRREWFAGQALAGILANPSIIGRWAPADMAFEAVEMAFDIADRCLPDPGDD